MADPVTVEELFEREYARLVGALAVAFGPEAAADAVQDAFVEADRRWTTVSGYDDPAGWVRRVALNRLRTRRRMWLRRSEILATIRPPTAPDHGTAGLDLRREIDRLPRQMRVVVCLHYLADLPVDEVADALGIAPGTVKSHLHDARKRLRTALEEPHVEPA
jgi:RNA polymerase sigma-70 factor (ECF subfamily)